MPEYRVTFGQKYRTEPHPHLRVVHPDGWVAILAADGNAAREFAIGLFGREWSMIYDAADHESEHYPRGELLRVIAPGAGAAYLLTGEMPDNVPIRDGYARGTLLVHVWADGTGEAAWRFDDRCAWGAPTTLRPAP